MLFVLAYGFPTCAIREFVWLACYGACQLFVYQRVGNTAHLALQNGMFCSLKRPVLRGDMGRIAIAVCRLQPGSGVWALRNALGFSAGCALCVPLFSLMCCLCGRKDVYLRALFPQGAWRSVRLCLM